MDTKTQKIVSKTEKVEFIPNNAGYLDKKETGGVQPKVKQAKANLKGKR